MLNPLATACCLFGLIAGTVAVPATHAAERKNDGLLYGRITTDNGTKFVGRLRWGTEEAAWGDFFNSTKEDRDLPRDMMRRAKDRSRRETIRVFGIPVGVRWKDFSDSRAFKARFGDIERIEPLSDNRALLTMRSGDEFEVEGGSNDLGATIVVWDEGVGQAEIDWSNIDQIEFMAAPRDLDVGTVFRLYGTVESTEGTFVGYVQWDQDEGLSGDKLDGETRDADLSLPMGRIASIERRSKRSARVKLKDGREFVLEGSNDVNDDNRGIFVEDERYGRVLIPWNAFERVDFEKPKTAGPSFASYDGHKRLRGTVTDFDGGSYTGLLRFDLDEAWSWEILDGNRRDIEYSIPFELIDSIVPDGPEGSIVKLRGGKELLLEDAVDVAENNDGILIEMNEGQKRYVAWSDVDRIKFSR